MATMTMTLSVAIGLVLACGGACVLARRRLRKNTRTKRVGEALATIRPGARDVERLTLVPRTALWSPFTGADDEATLGSQIEIAAEACVRLNRTIGVIYFEVPGCAQIALRDGKKRADAIASALAQTLRYRLRTSDHVAVLDGRRIVVCVCLLDKAADVEGVARRLAVVVARRGLTAGAGAQVRPGLAVYPPHGCSGSQLIAAAMRDYRTRLQSPDTPDEAPALQEIIPDRRPNRRGRLTVAPPPPRDDRGHETDGKP